MKKIFRSLWISLGLLFIQETANGEENLSFQKPCVQSSVYSTSYPQKAVDGAADTFSHTKQDMNAWWRVDLLKEYRVERVAVTNRLTPNYIRLNGAVIRVGNVPDVYSNSICAVIPTIPEGATASFSCGLLVGRYVIVHLPGKQEFLTLCEVAVYGFSIENLAFNGAATQSSTFSDWSAGRAIDGDRGLQQIGTGCSSTLNETNPWWRLDLSDIYTVDRVVVTNRNDCCAEQINGAEIHIGNSLENNGNDNPICAVIPSIPAGQSISFICDERMEGRFVNLIVPGDMKSLTMCELEVYGEGPIFRQSFLKLQFQSGADLTDPSNGEKVLEQLGSALADRGFTNVTLRWSRTPKPVKRQMNSGPGRCGKGK